MSTATLPAAQPPVNAAGPVLDVVIPVYNEQASLEACVRRLHAYLAAEFPYTARITIADNASTDTTLAVARRLARELPEVAVVHLPQKGRGRALATVWAASDASVLAYLDVDLSTDLAALLPLVAPLVTGHSDIAIGTRLAHGSRVVRGRKREVISRCYNLLLRGTLAVRFSDAQCGFKAIRRDVAVHLLPLVQDPGWFFDTELLVLAERSGLRIHEIPVDWIDDTDSRVDIVSTAVADLKGIARVGTALATSRLPMAAVRAQFGRAPLEPATDGVPAGLTQQLVRFAAIGLASTMSYLALYLLLHPALGAQEANAVAMLLTAIANTAANRRLTFGVTGRADQARHHLQGLMVFAVGLALTSGSLIVLHAITTPGRTLEVGVLVAANLGATLLRFLLLRRWVFRAGRHAPEVPRAPEATTLRHSATTQGPHMNKDVKLSRAVISRRRALGLGGSIGLGSLLAACGGGDSATDSATATSVPTSTGTATVQPSTTAAADVVALLDEAGTCTLAQEATQGPYWFDVDSIRSDLREDRPGTALTLALRVQDITECSSGGEATAVANSVVEIWHCDAGGIYSGFESGSTGGGGGAPPGGGTPPSDGSYSQGDTEAATTDDGTYLRGAQVADANGIVQFVTVYPGWYRGRTVHIHLKVHIDKKTVLTTQLYFDETLNNEVFATSPYDERTGRDTTNDNDSIFAEAGLLTVQPQGEGYLGLINLGIDV